CLGNAQGVEMLSKSPRIRHIYPCLPVSSGAPGRPAMKDSTQNARRRRMTLTVQLRALRDAAALPVTADASITVARVRDIVATLAGPLSAGLPPRALDMLRQVVVEADILEQENSDSHLAKTAHLLARRAAILTIAQLDHLTRALIDEALAHLE